MTMSPPPHKQRYRYKFRTFVDPPEYDSIEAGPFTPQQAAGFGSNEANRRTEVTGKSWVWDYEPIIEVEASLPWLRMLVLYALSIAFFLLGLFAFRCSMDYWWAWIVASILCGLALLRSDTRSAD